MPRPPRLRSERQPKPLDAAKLEELALAYVARFATTRAKLEAYLRRKLRERGWDGEAPARPEALCMRFVEAGYIDDAAWARMKAGSLLRRGYGERRVSQALHAAGIEAGLREDVAPGDGATRRAAMALAQRRRFGPWGSETNDRTVREKQLAAMLRAGHSLDIAREIVDATDPLALEDWARSADGDEIC
jgi:regulatory protein